MPCLQIPAVNWRNRETDRSALQPGLVYAVLVNRRTGWTHPKSFGRASSYRAYHGAGLDGTLVVGGQGPGTTSGSGPKLSTKVQERV